MERGLFTPFHFKGSFTKVIEVRTIIGIQVDFDVIVKSITEECEQVDPLSHFA